MKARMANGDFFLFLVHVSNIKSLFAFVEFNGFRMIFIVQLKIATYESSIWKQVCWNSTSNILKYEIFVIKSSNLTAL